VNIQDNDGRTALHDSVFHGHYEIVQYLITTCAIDIDVKDIDGYTALHYSLKKTWDSQFKIAHCLIDQGHADLTVTSNDGQNVFDIACGNKYCTEIVVNLLTRLLQNKTKNGQKNKK
jgi:ankyrin repeat protein